VGRLDEEALVTLIADRNGDMHDPRDVAEMLDDLGDRSSATKAELLHDAADVVRALATTADHCLLCAGMRILPNFMDAPGGPRCACGRPSTNESGSCGEDHGAIPCPRCGDIPCRSCLGKGAIEIWGTSPGGVRCSIDMMTCDRCDGTGKESAHAE
jgi:hypothetical protein